MVDDALEAEAAEAMKRINDKHRQPTRNRAEALERARAAADPALQSVKHGIHLQGLMPCDKCPLGEDCECYVAGANCTIEQVWIETRRPQIIRAILDDGGLTDVRLFASGNLDEYRIAALLAAGAPIDGFGVGTMLTTSGDAPSLDMVYKLQRYAGVPRRKRSEGKATWPDAKQVWRRRDAHGTLREDEITLADEIRSSSESTSLLVPVMQAGRRMAPPEPLEALRQHAADKLMHLPPALRALDPPEQPYPVTISPRLRALADELDREPH